MGAEHLAHRLRAAKDKQEKLAKESNTANCAPSTENCEDDESRDRENAADLENDGEGSDIDDIDESVRTAYNFDLNQLHSVTPADIAEARKLQDAFFDTYSGLKSYMNTIISKVSL